MLDQLLGISAAFAAAATLLLLVAGRLPLGWRITRIGVLLGIGVLIALASGWPANRLTGIDPADPLVLVAAAIGIVALTMPGRWWAIGSISFASVAVATSVYIIYLTRITLVLAGGPMGLLLGLVLLAFEIAALVLMVLSVFEMVDALCGPPLAAGFNIGRAGWGQRPTEGGRAATSGPGLGASQRAGDSLTTALPVVAVQVPAHAEPPDLVIETIGSIAALDYPRDRLVIQVIDNNTDDEQLWRPLKAECDRLAGLGYRIQFAHLVDWPGFKAGALNWANGQLPDDVEVIAVVDADYVVAPDFLTATVPQFADPSVAFVQTPQDYREWRDSAFYRACHAGFEYFFKVGMVSRSFRNSIIFAGTMGLVRRSAMEQIGGWDETVITEDAEASLRMLAAGGRGIFMPRVFGHGLMPLTYEGLRKQRYRWSFGGIQIIRKHWRQLLPWSESALTQRQRRDYLLGGFWWFNDLLTLGFLAFIAATALGVITGRPFVVQLLQGPGLVLPLLYLVLGLVRYVWGLRVATGVGVVESVAALRVNLSLAWVVTLACIRALVQGRGVFLRTPKVAGSDAVRSLRLVWVETMLTLGAGVLAMAVLFRAGLSTLTLTVDTLLLWSLFIYGSAITYAVADPSRPPERLRWKAALEAADHPVGRAIDRAPAITSGAAVALVALAAVAFAFVAQSGRPPVQGAGGVANAGLGPIPGGLPSSPAISPAPSATGSPLPGTSPGASPAPSGTPSPAPSGGAPTSTPVAPTGTPAPSPTASPPPATATPTAQPSSAPATQAPSSSPAAGASAPVPSGSAVAPSPSA